MTSTAAIILFNKPHNVLCQFTDQSKTPRETLANYIKQPNFYCAGRLDFDSEGLLLLTDNGALQNQICDPKAKMAKSYWVQVEGAPSDQQLSLLRQGLALKDGMTRPARASLLTTSPVNWPREKPLASHRENNSRWLEIVITEGRNRQVRRMCAAIGHPVLRLVRSQIGPWQLNTLSSGEFRIENINLSVKRKTTKAKTVRPRPSNSNR